MNGKTVVSLWLVASFVLFSTASASAEPTVVERDRERIRAHLLEVETELESRDVSHLPDELREARRQNIEVLRQYRREGEFPRNTHVPYRQPVFIDRDDRACAVAHLMIESGWEEEARRISERENLSYLFDMESVEVEQWLAESGLTAEEAARIQPTYNSCNDDCSCEVDPVCGDDGKTYVNSCFAENCGGVDNWSKGCCEESDFISSTYDDEYGAMGLLCDEDPNDKADEYCPEGVDQPNPDTDAGTDAGAADAASYDDAGASRRESLGSRSCAHSPTSPGAGADWLVFVGLFAVAATRRVW